MMQINGYIVGPGEDLTGADLRGAIYNDRTIWPVGYVPDFSKMQKSS